MEKAFVAENGLKIYSYKNPGLHSFYISLFFKGGSMYERADECGITHFLEHVSIRNVNKLMGGTLYESLDKLGLEFNASSFAEMVQFYMSGAKKNFLPAQKIFKHLLSPIVLGKAEIDAERKRIKAEIRESDDKSSLSTFTAEITHKGTSLANSIVGTNKSVDRITGKRLEEYRRRNFTRENLFVYVTGNFEDSDIEALCRELGEYPLFDGEMHSNFAPVPTDFGKREPTVYIKNADFTMVRFTFDIDVASLGIPCTDLIYDILLSGYASRFFIEMSEKRGLFYDINGALERYRNVGELYFSYELREHDIYEAIKITVDILNDLKKSPLSEDSLMKAAYVDNANNLYDDPREFNFTMAYDAHVMNAPYRSIEDRTAAYSSVTAQDVMNAARKIFKRSNLCFTMKGKKKKTDTEKINRLLDALDI